jgi:glutamate dehydrogenase
MNTLYTRVLSFVIGPAKERQRKVAEDHASDGVPDKLARQMASLLLTRGGLDITDLSQLYRKDILETARMYSELTERLGVIWLNRSIEGLKVHGRWQAIARSNLRQEFYEVRRELSEGLMKKRGKSSLTERFETWLEVNADAVHKYDNMLADMKIRQSADFAALSVAAQELRKLTEQ